MTRIKDPAIFDSIPGQRVLKLIKALIIIGFSLLVFLIFSPVFFSAMYANKIGRAMDHLKKIGAASLGYTEDHKQCFPHADSWTDEIGKYLKDKESLRDPYGPGDNFGYAMNSDLSGKSYESIQNPAGTIMFYETKRPGKNLSQPSSQIPNDTMRDDSTNVVFVNGHTGFLTGPRLQEAANHPDTFDPHNFSKNQVPHKS